MPLHAFVFAVIVMFQTMFICTPALATEVWVDDITMRIENDGCVSVEDQRTHYGSSDERPLVMEWGLVDVGASFESGTYAGLEVGELDANGKLVPYREVKDADELEVGDYAIVEDGGHTSIALRLKNPSDGEATYCASYHVSGAVRRWSDAGEARLRLWNPSKSQDTGASFELLFPNNEDGRPIDTPADLQAWDHTIMKWEEGDYSVYPIVAEEMNGRYGVQGSALLTEGIAEEIRALFPETLLFQMDQLPQREGEKVRAAEEAAADAYEKVHEEELRQFELDWESRQSAHDQRLAVEEPLFLSLTIGLGVYAIYQARRIRRAYKQSHLQHVDSSWYWHMLKKNGIDRGGGEPEAEGVGDAMLSDGVHPLVVGWALTGGSLAYSAIVATLARLSTLGVVEIVPAYVSKSKWYSELSLLGVDYSGGSQDEWMLIFHKERFGLVGDPLDRAVLDMFIAYADIVSGSESINAKRSAVSTRQEDGFLFSDLRRMAVWERSQYLRQLRLLRDTLNQACHAQGLDDDQETLDKRTFLKRLGILYTCVLAVSNAVGMAEQSVALLASSVIAIVVPLYLVGCYQAVRPISKRAVQLRSELGCMRLWLHGQSSDSDEASKGFDAQTWQLVIERALVLGEDDEVADRIRRYHASAAQNADVQALLKWCGGPCRGIVWAFEDAMRQAQQVRAVKPLPNPCFTL